jgi:thiol-disulfide isomerase/thioredoxin
MRKAIGLLLIANALAIAALAAAPVPGKANEFVIHTPEGKDMLLSSYRGKTVVLALMFTTCPHCQKVAQILSSVQKEYADRGVQVLGATFDPNAATQVKQFDQIFVKGFPCGYSSNNEVLRFLQQPATNPPFVPIFVFIDKAGIIRALHMVTGDTPENGPEQKFFATPEVTIRAELDKMLKGEKTSSAAASAPKKSPKS